MGQRSDYEGSHLGRGPSRAPEEGRDGGRREQAKDRVRYETCGKVGRARTMSHAHSMGSTTDNAERIGLAYVTYGLPGALSVATDTLEDVKFSERRGAELLSSDGGPMKARTRRLD